MTRKLSEIDDGSMGDISSVIGRGPVADLSWLAVDEEEYRKKSVVPHQNLDIIPELSRALQQTPEGIPERLPYKDILIVNENPLYTPALRFEDLNKITRQAAHYVYRGDSKDEVLNKLSVEWPADHLQQATGKIASILEDQGLLGNVYIASDHFGGCVNNKNEIEFVRKHAKKALYVLGSEKCNGCVKNINGRCASFSKYIVDQIPYDQNLLNHYKQDLEFTGRLSSDLSDPKQALRVAFRTPEREIGESSGNRLWTQTNKPERVASLNEALDWYGSVNQNAPDVVSSELLVASKKLMMGKTSAHYLAQNPDPQIRSLSSYDGILGRFIVDMDALGGCSKTASFIKEKGLKDVLYFVRRASTCSYCKCGAGGFCDKFSRVGKIVSDLPHFTVEDFSNLITAKVASGVMTPSDGTMAIKRFAGIDPASGLAVVKRLASLSQPLSERRDYGSKSEVAFTGGSPQVKEEDISGMSEFIGARMNEGTYGATLMEKLSSRYSSRQIEAFKRTSDLLDYDGIQGHYFIDPTVYSDFGRGCKTGSHKYRGTGAKHLKASSVCNDCVKQNSPGWCSAYAKPLLSVIDSKVASEYKKKVSLPILASDLPTKDISDIYELGSEISVDIGVPRRKFDPQV